MGVRAYTFFSFHLLYVTQLDINHLFTVCACDLGHDGETSCTLQRTQSHSNNKHQCQTSVHQGSCCIVWLSCIVCQKQYSEHFPALLFIAFLLLTVHWKIRVKSSLNLHRGVISATKGVFLEILSLGIERRGVNILILNFNQSPVTFLCKLFTVKQPHMAFDFCLFICTNAPWGPMRIGAVHPLTVTQCTKSPIWCTKYFHLPHTESGKCLLTQSRQRWAFVSVCHLHACFYTRSDRQEPPCTDTHMHLHHLQTC